MNNSQLVELYYKKDLEELYHKRNYPTNEFTQSPAFASLESDVRSIEIIERFRLPEITKLICCSSALSQLPWAKEYTQVRPLYLNPSQIDVSRLFEEYPDPKVFNTAIVQYADPNLLNVLIRTFEQFNEERKGLTAKRRKIVKGISQLNSAALSPDEYAAKKAEYERRMEEIDNHKTSITALCKKLEKHRNLIKKSIKNNTEDVIELRRKDAYETLFASISAEEIFLKQFIRNGELSNEMRALLQSERFCVSALQYMDRGSYRETAVLAVMRLYEQGTVDLESPFIMEYIRTHASLVSDYLCARLSDLIENETSDDRALLDVVLRIESAHCMQSSTAIFNTFWNAIQEPDLWLMIFNFAVGLNLPDIYDAMYGLMKGLEDDASKALVEALFTQQAQDMGITAAEAISAVLRNQANISPALVTSVFQKMEQLSRAAQRKLRAAERKINGQGKALFSSIYEPLKRLELLASDLRMSSGNIPCHLVANQLVDLISSLRSGMLQMNLYPVCDIDDWRRGRPIPYNAGQHIRPMNAEDDPNKIILQTMGFRYLGDDGQWQQYNAQVVIKPISQPATKSDQNDKKNADWDGDRPQRLNGGHGNKKKGNTRRFASSPSQRNTSNCGTAKPASRQSVRREES